MFAFGCAPSHIRPTGRANQMKEVDWKADTLQPEAFRLCLLCLQSDGGDFRKGVDTTRHFPVINVFRLSHDVFNGRHAFGRGCVGKHHPSDHIPDRIEPFDVRLHSRIHLDRSSLHLKPDLFKVEPLRAGNSSDGLRVHDSFPVTCFSLMVGSPPAFD